MGDIDIYTQYFSESITKDKGFQVIKSKFTNHLGEPLLSLNDIDLLEFYQLFIFKIKSKKVERICIDNPSMKMLLNTIIERNLTDYSDQIIDNFFHIDSNGKLLDSIFCKNNQEVNF